MPPFIKRRRFSYSLRTFVLVTTLIGCWLGWNILRVRERDRSLAMILSYGGFTSSYPPSQQTGRLPLAWRVIGARRFDAISVPSKMYVDRDARELSGFDGFNRLQYLFPEAKIWIGSKLSPGEPDHRYIPLSAFPPKPTPIVSTRVK